jgi:CrcB protein
VCTEKGESSNPLYWAAVPVLLAIALGGALGSMARWAVEALLPASPAGWPWGTLTVNVVGALAIGVLAGSARLRSAPAWVRPLLITGVLGGFTTVSALAGETVALLDGGQVTLALGYIGVTLAAGLVAVRLGARAGVVLEGPR